MHTVIQTVAHFAANGSPGRVTVPLIPLIMAGALIALISLVWARRTFAFEIVVCLILFGLLGATPLGRTVYDWLGSI